MNNELNIIEIARIVVPVISVAVTIILTHFFTSQGVKRDLNNKALQNRYHKVYAPLIKSLLGVHIISVSGGYKFVERIKRSIKYFIIFKFKEGLIILKHPHTNYGHEVIFGQFPMNKIRKILLKNGSWADPKLLMLVQSADLVDNERFEKSPLADDAVLTSEEIKLFDHIYSGYKRLNKRLLPNS